MLSAGADVEVLGHGGRGEGLVLHSDPLWDSRQFQGSGCALRSASASRHTPGGGWLGLVLTLGIEERRSISQYENCTGAYMHITFKHSRRIQLVS